ncbi:unnamed protein product [Cunninghamella blakesleeana]
MRYTEKDYIYSVNVQNLSFDYGGPPILKDLTLQLKPGSRCILVGANGAGKTTLLRILGGKRMMSGIHVNALGKNVFHESPKNLTYLGTEWGNNPVVKSDLSVGYLLYSMGAKRWPERTQRLLDVLDVDIKWRLHQVSDGQRRRVQLVMGLLQPWELLLLDEVTVDLDVLVRADFLAYLKEETESRGATIVYATHIFDGLGQWPTEVVHMTDGTVASIHKMDETFEELEKIRKEHELKQSLDSPLMALCYLWLRDDRKQLRNQQKEIEADTGLPHSKWDELKDLRYGDKYYNYWN